MTGSALPLQRRRLVRLLMLAAVGLVVAWIVTPHAVPIYDGVGFPDEPYRYVHPPPGVDVHTSAPTAAVGTTVLAGGTNPSEMLAPSQEQGPQVVVFIGVHAARAPVAATSLTVRAVPRAPDAPPAGVKVDGNAYRVTIQSNAGPVTLDRNLVAALQLRATTAAQPGPSIYFRAAGGRAWLARRTQRVGTDIYQALMPGQGDYLVAFAAGTSSTVAGAPAASTGSSSGSTTLVIVLGIVVLAMAAIVLAIRFARSRNGRP